MPNVVTEACRDCRYTDCVVVCPVECFYGDERMLYIDPDDCTCCEACTPECPAEAIYPQERVPELWRGSIALNVERVRALKALGPVREKQDTGDRPGCRGAKAEEGPDPMRL